MEGAVVPAVKKRLAGQLAMAPRPGIVAGWLIALAAMVIPFLLQLCLGLCSGLQTVRFLAASAILIW